MIATGPCPIEVEFERRMPSSIHGWHLLEAAARRKHHTIWFDGQKVLEVEDSTFGDGGKVGMITYADTVALFDDFAVQAAAGRPARAAPAIERHDPLIVHVPTIEITDATFKTVLSSLARGELLRWKVKVEDESEEPVAGAIVEAEVVRADGSLFDTQRGMTGSDGSALFTMRSQLEMPVGQYNVRIKSVRSVHSPDARYAPSANLISASTFMVR